MAKKKRVLLKNLIISKVGVHNKINFSNKVWDVAISLAKAGHRNVPAGLGHTNFFTYNPTLLEQQKASGLFLNVDKLPDGKIKADLDTTEDIAESIENKELISASIEGILHNPVRDESGIVQADGMTLTGVALLGRDQPAVPEACLTLLRDSQTPLTDSALAELSQKGEDARFKLTWNLNSQDLEQAENKEKEMDTSQDHKPEFDMQAELEKIKNEFTVQLKEKEDKVVELTNLNASFQNKLAKRDRFQAAAFTALSKGVITPADYAREQASLDNMSEEQLVALEKKWKESAPATSPLTDIGLAGRADSEKDEMEKIQDEINLMMNKENISLNEAAKKYYEQNPNARQF